MAEVIRALRDTPLPTLFVIIGFVMLSVGFGLRVQAVINVDQINKTYAKIVGIVFLVLGLVLYGTSLVSNVGFQPTDPFLVYYLVAVPMVVVLYWAMLKSTNGETQIRAAKLSFMLVGALVAVVVLWRVLDVYFYLHAPDPQRSIPLGL